MTRILRRIALVVLAGAVVVLVMALGTGRIRYVSTHGVSMIPTYHNGEFVVVARADHYRIGDIVAYPNAGDGVTVLHRIVGGDANGWELRGDNNESLDVGHPTSHQILGRAIANVGGLGRVVASPLAMGIGGGAAALCIIGILTLVTRRRPPAAPDEPADEPVDEPVDATSRIRWPKVGLVALDVLAAGAMTAALLFPVHATSAPPPIQQHGTFRYQGSASVSDAYPDGRIVTGDAVFTRLATKISVFFDYGSDAAADQLSGSVQLDLQLDNRSGWRRATQLVPPTNTVDGAVALSATLDLGDIQAKVDRVADESGIAATTVDIIVRATVRASLRGAPASTTQFELPLQLTPRALSIPDAAGSAVVVRDTDEGRAVVLDRPVDAPQVRPATTGIVSDGERRVIFFALLGAVVVTFALWPAGVSQPSPQLRQQDAPLAEGSDPDQTPTPEPILTSVVADDLALLLRHERRRAPRTGHATGSFPEGIACDGRSVWVANSGGNTVSQIDAVEHTRTDHTTGEYPRGVALDGTNVWVANSASNTVSRIDPATGVRTDFPTGDGPQAITHDGTHVWVTNSRSNTVSRIDPRSGMRTEYAVGPNPSGIAFDGWYIWVANFGSDTVTRLDPRQAEPGNAVDYTVGPNPMGVAFDGRLVWVANFGADTVSALDPRDAAPGHAVHHPVGLNPRGLAWDGNSMWVTNFSSGTVSKIDPGGSEPGTAVTYATGSHPSGVSSDGTSIWVTNFSANTVSVIRNRQEAGASTLEAAHIAS